MNIWPEVFTTGIVEGKSKAELCADGLSAWALCMAGNRPPENFGDVIVKISSKLEILGTPESFMEWANANGY